MVPGGFVGRTAELTAIEAALRWPEQSLVLVRGETGIGKSALLRAVLRGAADGAASREFIAAALGDRHIRFSATAALLSKVVGREGGSASPPTRRRIHRCPSMNSSPGSDSTTPSACCWPSTTPTCSTTPPRCC